MSLPSIGSLWIGDELSWLEQLCLQSFVDHGHEVVLYSYGRVGGVPRDVRLADANDILPSTNIIRHARTGSPAYHADVFRLEMLSQTDHVWADTDALCCQPWDVKRGKHFHGWISDDKPLVNNGVLRLPKTSKTLKAMLKFTSDEYPIPPWYNDKKKATLQELKDKGQGTHVSLLPWGVWGPDALTWFLKETGEIENSLPGHVIYPVPFAVAGVTLNPNRVNKAQSYIKPDTLSVHFWGRRFRNIAAKYDGVPAEGSYVSKLLERHKIDPSKTAHLIQEAAEDKTPMTRDFSMFTTIDLANLVLQRSEPFAAGPEIRAWISGDSEPLMTFAKANRDEILTKTFAEAEAQCNLFVEHLDAKPPKRIADIGCGYAFADLILYNRFGSEIVLLDIEQSEDRHFGFEDAGSGYSDLEKAKQFLVQNGVPDEKITTINPQSYDVAKTGNFDLVISLASCGFHYPLSTYEDLFSKQIDQGGALVVDVRKGSGGIPYLKKFGSVNVLEKREKDSSVLTRMDK